jgi:hypothetical protein
MISSTSSSSLDEEQASGLELCHFLPSTTTTATARVDTVPVLFEASPPQVPRERVRESRLGWIVMVALLLAACLTTLTVLLQSPHPNEENTTTKTPPASYYGSLERLLWQASQDDPLLPSHLLWNDPMSPQYLALEWMAYRDDGYFVNQNTDDNNDDNDDDSLSLSLLPWIQQRFALITLFYASGMQWHDEWLRSGVNECQFSGIVCNAQNQVTLIDLKRVAMTGSLPHELGWLTHLTRLDLQDNRLRGSIPPGLLHLPHILQLDLSANQLDGVMPNKLPPNLQVLNLEHNILQGQLPDWPLSLQMAKLAYNRWTGSLPSFPQGNELIYLDVVDTQIAGTLPTSIGYLTKLKSLSVYQTQLQGALPTELGLLQALEELSMGMTQMNGTLPEELWQATNLEWLVAVQHQFHGTISTGIGNLKQLRVLNLLNGPLKGSLPASLGSLPNLTWLQLAMNQMTGSIPVELSHASSLREYNVYNVYGYGATTTATHLLSMFLYISFHSLFFLLCLEKIWLQGNDLEGTVSSEFCNWPSAGLDFRTDCGTGNVECECCTECY